MFLAALLKLPTIRSAMTGATEMTSFGVGRGVYQPEELAEMQRVFEEITSELWFDRRPEARKSFAKYLLENYPDGSYDPIIHRAVIEDVARKYFSGLPGRD
ncbi:hypothetical protein [Shinella zoogloeoides]|uniref:hypothetical protein n=1 Tax=Shinella zoogloeoides TaxID=352475 RepID=UPI0027400D4E|nr:hypothetical protein [Shinella zoogloeoides]WLR94261.1 hypothetical protein Q9316_08860 [Shinella zoogloeoides]